MADKKVVRSDLEWQQTLTPEQYEVTRRKGTERPFSGTYSKHDKRGVYNCVCCGNRLFGSEAKFDSGTGWPSFWAPASNESVKTKGDATLFMKRTEILCSRCGGHLGHVFDDGPAPTGQRYCVNSAALAFEEDKN